ncbi:MAG: DUF126 domain-containing protein [Thermoplasmatota archaeon]
MDGVGLRGVGAGKVSGEVVFHDGPLSFLGDVDPDKGTLIKNGETIDIRDKVLIFTEGAGSTVGSYVIYNLKLNGKAPKALVMRRADAIISIGCILGDIPLVHRVPAEGWPFISNGDLAEVDPSNGEVRIWNRHTGSARE